MRQTVWRVFNCSLHVIFTLFLLIVSTANIYGQSAGSTTGSVTGIVTDETGAVIGSVIIKARNTETNLTRETVTREDGSFVILQLPPGSYELEVSSEGFGTKKYLFDLVLGTTALVNSTLKPVAGEDVIEVVANTNFSLTRTDSSTNIDQMSIANLPINRRNFLDFTLTAARVINDGNGVGAASSSGLSFNGQNARFNNVTIDGLDNNDRGSGSVRATFSQDAVQEFQIISDSYSAEYGRALGGVVNIVTKGGSNQFHGSLFFLNRNEDISARQAFSPINPRYRQYQFGATVGGAIQKDRLFYFGSFERLTIKQNNVVTIADQTVASARRLGFDLSNGPIPFSLGTSTFLGRLDYQLTPNNRLFLRYNGGFSFNSGFENFGALQGYSNSGRQELDDNTFALNNTYVNTGLNLINETRFLFTSRNQDVFPINNDTQVRIVAPEGNVTFGRSSFLPQPRDQKFYQFVNNLSLTRGKHQLKFGTDLFFISPPDGKSALPVLPGGLATFSPLNFTQLIGLPNLPSFTGLEAFDPAFRSPAQKQFLTLLAALLPSRAPGFPAGLPLAELPLPTAFLQGFGDANEEVPAQFYSFYAQDDIRLRSNLLIKLGLRYDLNRARFVPDNNGNFSPRIAFSYRPQAIENLNVHGSYGVFYTVPITGIAVAVGLSESQRVKLSVLPFPFSVIPFSLPGRRFGTSLPSNIPDFPQLSQGFTFQKDLRNSYAQQANFGFDYLIKNNLVASVNYDMVRGVKLFSARNINPIVRPVASTLTSALQGRVDPSKGDIILFESAADSNYHALTLSLTQRFSNHFSLLAHYTWSKAIDNNNDFGALSREFNDSLDIGAERGLSQLDVRSRFVLSGVWDLNYTKNRFLTGFQLSSIITLSSGRPYNLLAGIDLNRNGDNPPGDRPTGLGRNVGVRPGFAGVDLRLSRSISFNERYRIDLFAEAFNLFNRTNISEVDRVFLPDAQGNFQLPQQEGGRYIVTPDRFRDAFAPRQFQFGFRVTY